MHALRSHATRRVRSGFTLLELLIAATVMIILLGASTALLVQSNRAYGVNQVASERQQEIEAAVKILSYDLSLAGYRGTTPTSLASNSFGSDASIVIEKNGATAGGSDRLVVRYFEDGDRLFGGDDLCGSPCVVTYDVDEDEDDSTLLLLYRKEGSATERGIVQAVQSFAVRQVITRSGGLLPATTADSWPTEIPSDLAGLSIEIVFTDGGIWRFPVGVTNLQALP